jgi:hypothetical protein
LTPERWRQIERIFHAALDRPSREREAFLDEQCRGRRRFGRLVAAFVIVGAAMTTVGPGTRGSPWLRRR